MLSWAGGGKEEQGEVPLSGLDGVSSHVSFQAAEPVCQNGSYSPISSPKRKNSEQNLEHTG